MDHASEKQLGTVGAVAVDVHGNVAAATSTGGMTNKKFGRIGDTPIIGGGTYANNKTCAVSCTGHGEFFIRTVLAHEVSALIEFKNLSLRKAANFCSEEKTRKTRRRWRIDCDRSEGKYCDAFQFSRHVSRLQKKQR